MSRSRSFHTVVGLVGLSRGVRRPWVEPFRSYSRSTVRPVFSMLPITTNRTCAPGQRARSVRQVGALGRGLAGVDCPRSTLVDPIRSNSVPSQSRRLVSVRSTPQRSVCSKNTFRSVPFRSVRFRSLRSAQTLFRLHLLG
eukprot:1002508-Prorocentrum_minimum.AAC.4